MPQLTLDAFDTTARCPKCGEYFKNKTGVKIHYGRSHDGSIAGDKVECYQCGTEFRKTPAVIEQSERHFCNRECWSEWRSDFLSGKNNPMYGVSGEDAPAHGRTGEDHPMYGRTGSKNPMWGKTGEDHPQWKGGTEEHYGSNWHRIRENAIKRDEEVCQVDGCQVTREQHKNQYGRDIHVHHKVKKRLFEAWGGRYECVELEHANALRNLITVCQQCHAQLD